MITVFVGERIIVSSIEPTRSGHVFLGWSLSPDNDTTILRAGDTVTVTENTTLYALWEEIVLPPEPPIDEETDPLPDSESESLQEDVTDQESLHEDVESGGQESDADTHGAEESDGTPSPIETGCAAATSLASLSFLVAGGAVLLRRRRED